MSSFPMAAEATLVARLATEGLSKSFPGTERSGQSVEVLRGVDLHIGAGEFVSIVGPSGCGKSTLLSLLAGLERPTDGEILLDGESTERLLGRVGLMPQNDLLFPWRSVLDNAALASELRGEGRREARARASDLLGIFGLSGFERAWPSELSGGMRQRAALARTFLTGREVLMLDEPFGALDALTRREMQEWLLDVLEGDPKTVLLVTHDVEEALFLSDRVYVMSARPGRIEAELVVDLPRPREFTTMTTSQGFVEMKARLLDALGRPGAGDSGR